MDADEHRLKFDFYLRQFVLICGYFHKLTIKCGMLTRRVASDEGNASKQLAVNEEVVSRQGESQVLGACINRRKQTHFYSASFVLLLTLDFRLAEKFNKCLFVLSVHSQEVGPDPLGHRLIGQL